MGYRSGMALSSDATPNRIVGYSDGEIRLADRRLTRSAIITAERVDDWPVDSVADLDADRVAPLLGLGVDVVLLATGRRQEFPAPAVLARVSEARIGLEVMDLGAACRTYNVLLAEDRAVALAAILPGTR